MSKKEFILGKIKETVNQIHPHSEIYLYGSRARGHARKQSDWDVLILLNTSNVSFELEMLFIDALYEIEIETGEVISPMVYSKNEWNLKHSFNPLYENISREGIRI
jgi:predicted nucleotidyltransferase